MKHLRRGLLFLSLAAPLALSAAFIDRGASAEKKSPSAGTGRKLLYPAKAEDVAGPIRRFVTSLLSADQGPVKPTDVRPQGVFVRVLSRQHVLADGALKKGGFLGGRPFVFVTLPEALYGRS